MNRSDRIAQAATFLLLVAIGVVGRWGQPDWCVTPLAATGLLAGYWFASAGLAVAVPIVAMLISDFLLPSYDSMVVQLTVYGALGASALVGRWLRRPVASPAAGWVRLVACGAAPSLFFFVATNFACWASSVRYEKSLAGLVQCYAAALPFLRRMMGGDLAYVALLFTAAAAAGAFSLTAGRSAVEQRACKSV